MILDWTGKRGGAWALCLVVVGGCLAPSTNSGAPPPATLAPGPTSTLQPVATGTPPTKSADEIFDRVAPSVAFVATDVGTGSALTLDDRHVVTNAHVVRPYDAARVRFANGTEVTDAPVVGWDLIADLAVLDVGVGLGRRPLATNDEIPRTGARVYLVGYPLAESASPSATITEGIISSAPYEWIEGLTFLQTDATIDDGQSGGVLVDADGRLLGITGASRGRFATAIDAGDAMARVDRLLAGDDVDGTGEHMLIKPDPKAPTKVVTTLRHRADAQVWIIAGARGDTPAKVSMTSDRPVGLFGLAAAGKLGQAAGPPGKDLKIEMPFDAVGPYAVKLESATGRAAHVTLRSSTPLTAYVDLDDGRSIDASTPLIGAMDYAGDIDWYVITLRKGDAITVRASAEATDPALFIDRVGDDPAPLAFGHDDGGPLGGDDVVEFKAPADGEYLVVVTDPRYLGAGAYRLEVARD
jgi:serine protease DegQ